MKNVLSKYLYEHQIFNKSIFSKTTNITSMKKVILGAFMLLAVAGTTMAQTAKQDQTGGKHSSKMHHGKKHHRKAGKSSASSTDAGAGTSTGTGTSTQK